MPFISILSGIHANHTEKCGISLVMYGGVIDLNTGREFNFYRKTGIMRIVVSLAQSNLFCFNNWVDPV